MGDVTQDLNATIASAVQARIEAEVAAAMSGSEMIGQYVTAALNQPIEVSVNGSRYDTEKTTWLRHTIDTAMREATKVAVERLIAERAPQLEEAVRAALEEKTGMFAAQLVENLGERVANGYSVSVELKSHGRG